MAPPTALLPSKLFIIEDLTKLIDIDEGIDGKREIPSNMIWYGQNELTTDTGVEEFATGSDLVKSLYVFRKNDGTDLFLRNLGTVQQALVAGTFTNFRTGLSSGKTFDYADYDGFVYFGNGYDAHARYDGTTLTTYGSAPKGDIYEMFEERLFIAGDPAAPLTIYYSNVGDPTTFTGSDVIKLKGSDKVVGMKSFYNALIVLKERSVWKVQFEYDPVSTTYIPKIDLMSDTFGCIGKRAYTQVENDVWFFTGKDVRRIGFLGREANQVAGFDPLSQSNQIQEALKLVNPDYAQDSVAFFTDRKFLLAVPQGGATTTDTIYVCDTYHGKQWTKLTNRPKAKAVAFATYQNYVYSASSEEVGTVWKWSSDYLDDGAVYTCKAPFMQIGDKDSATTQIYRYLDLSFRNSNTIATVDLYFDDFDERIKRTKGFTIESQAGGTTLGGSTFGLILWGGGTTTAEEDISDVDYLKRRISMLEKGSAIKVVISSAAGSPLTLKALALEYKERNRRYFDPNLIISVG